MLCLQVSSTFDTLFLMLSHSRFVLQVSSTFDLLAAFTPSVPPNVEEAAINAHGTSSASRGLSSPEASKVRCRVACVFTTNQCPRLMPRILGPSTSSASKALVHALEKALARCNAMQLILPGKLESIRGCGSPLAAKTRYLNPFMLCAVRLHSSRAV